MAIKCKTQVNMYGSFGQVQQVVITNTEKPQFRNFGWFIKQPPHIIVYFDIQVENCFYTAPVNPNCHTSLLGHQTQLMRCQWASFVFHKDYDLPPPPKKHLRWDLRQAMN